MSKILATGVIGSVGRALVYGLTEAKHEVILLARNQSIDFPEEVSQVVAGELKTWTFSKASFYSMIGNALKDIDIVINLAARVHVMDDASNDPLAEYQAENTDATLELASSY